MPSACRLRENAGSLAFDDGIKLERVDWKPPERGRRGRRKPEAEQAEAPFKRRKACSEDYDDRIGH